MATVTRLVYFIPGNDQYTIDIAKDLSAVHRKLHRQKMTYTVLGGQIKESNGSTFYFKTAPPAWTTNVAIRRAFNVWRKSRRELFKNTDITNPKWSDFKVLLDSNHNTTNILDPMMSTTEEDGEQVPYSMGEWNYADLVQPKLIDPDNDGGLEFDDNADSWVLMIVGDHDGNGDLTVTEDGERFYEDYTRVGIIRSWYNSRSIPRTSDPGNAPAGPSGVRTDPLSNLFNVQDDDSEMLTVVEQENDQAPYDYNGVPGMNDNELQLVAFADNDQGEGSGADVQVIPGFQAACGLVRIEPSGNNGAVLMLDVIAEGERI